MIVIVTCPFGRFVGEVEGEEDLRKRPIKLKKPCSIVAAEVQVPHPQYKGVMQKQMRFAMVYEGFSEINIDGDNVVWAPATNEIEQVYRREIARAAGIQIVSMEELQQLQQQAARAMQSLGMPHQMPNMGGAPQRVKPNF